MLGNFIKVMLRNFKRYKGYSFINVAGLAIGMACCILILLWIQDESSYDDYHHDVDRIYRVAIDIRTQTANRVFAPICPMLTPTIKKDLPQVEQVVRFFPQRNLLVKYGEEKRFYEDRFAFVDPEVFDVFTVSFIKGDPATALNRPRTVVITERIARKYFGDENPMGKSLIINRIDAEVSGVIADVPQNTHNKFDFLSSLKIYEKNRMMTGWHSTMFYTYIKTNNPVDKTVFAAQINDIVNGIIGSQIKDWGVSYHFFLQPIKDIHLYSNLRYEIEPPGNSVYIYVFSAIALFVLLIACLNFINLSTARSTNRAREVGMRKVVGARRIQLIRQFLSESLFLSFLALLLAVGVIALVLPWFSDLAGKDLSISALFAPQVLSGLLGIALLAGIVAGSYPAFFLSSFRPAAVIRGSAAGKGKGNLLRKGLVISQFAISIMLVIGTITVFQQLNYMKNQNLGFDRDQMLILPLRGGINISQNFETVKREFSDHPAIQKISVSASIPGRGVNNFATSLIGEEDDKQQSMFYLGVDHDFFNTYDIDLAAGRIFEKTRSTDVNSAIMINEAAVKAFGWSLPETALGKRIQTGFGAEGEIIGVYRDFHYRSLQTVIEPLIIMVVPRWFRTLSLKVNTGNLSDVMGFIQEKWNKFFPQNPFEYFFLDADFDRLYRTDEQAGRIVMLFTGFAIFIACLGLFGLASFMAEKRTKEIGIRKVLGSSVARILMLLTKEFSKWIIAANLIAWPAAYFILDKWLKNFAVHTQVKALTLVLAGVLALFIALVTVSYQSFKAATADPVDCLRYE